MPSHLKEFLEVFYKEIQKIDEDISLYRYQKVKNELK